MSALQAWVVGARIIGGACIALAVLFLVDGLWWLARATGIVTRVLA